MKSFETINFDSARRRQELVDFGELLAQNVDLSERREIKPFFSQRKQLSASIGMYMSNEGDDLLAFEWSILGDFVADIVVGNRETKTFCMVELESGDPNSIFTSRGTKSTKDWSRAFEHGFSQLVDWFFALDDFCHTRGFSDDFGPGHVKFHRLLVIGRSAELSETDRRRLRWREERVLVNSHPIHCVTYDELHRELGRRLAMYPAAATSASE